MDMMMVRIVKTLEWTRRNGTYRTAELRETRKVGTRVASWVERRAARTACWRVVPWVVWSVELSAAWWAER
jgi:hypothetical protein